MTVVNMRLKDARIGKDSKGNKLLTEEQFQALMKQDRNTSRLIRLEIDEVTKS